MQISASPEEWGHFVEAVRTRMSALGLTPVTLAERIGRTPGWVRSVLRAGTNSATSKTTFNEHAMYQLMAGLGWSASAVRSLMSGAEPDPDPSPPAASVAMVASGSNVDMAALAAILGPHVEAVDRQTAALKEQDQRIEQVLERLDQS